MGNNRKAIEANLVKNLNVKIREAKSLLAKLNEEEKELEVKTLTAQKKVESSVAELEAELRQTKQMLLDEIGKESSTNMRDMKEKIMKTCGTIGSLENMLSQLDKFDQSQLLNVKIPELTSNLSEKDLSILDSNFAPGSLMNAKREIRQWGADVMEDAEIRWLCTVNGNIIKDMDELKNDFGKRKLTIEPSESENDFLYYYKKKLDAESPTMNVDELFPPFTSNEFNWIPSKPIVSVNKDDLSLWLKPKKNNLDFEQNFESLSLTSTEKKKILDFPCLDHEPSYWMKRKSGDEPSEKKAKRDEENGENVKPQNTSIVEKRSFFNEENDYEFIPPSYALPDPFWLKKYC